MGAINYGKSDYITLGIKPIDRQEMRQVPTWSQYRRVEQ